MGRGRAEPLMGWSTGGFGGATKSQDKKNARLLRSTSIVVGARNPEESARSKPGGAALDREAWPSTIWARLEHCRSEPQAGSSDVLHRAG